MAEIEMYGHTERGLKSIHKATTLSLMMRKMYRHDVWKKWHTMFTLGRRLSIHWAPWTTNVL